MAKKKSKQARPQNVQPPQPASRWNAILLRAVFFVVFLGISGTALTLYRSYSHSDKPLHEFRSQERGAFVASLKGQGIPTRTVWLACPEGKPETCQLVRQFVAMFQESGWQVEGGKVVTWKPAHPLDGVHMILRAAGGDGDTTPADAAGVKSALTILGIPAQSASAPDVPKNSIGIYFGPDL